MFLKNEHNPPLVSVVITTHNRRKKVLRTIRSVLDSVNPENILEIIVIDDASTDGTIQSVKNVFPRNNLKILRCEQEQLVSECRNMGLKEANGEYVFFLDDDVIVSRDALSKLLNFLLQNENVACVIPMILYYHKPNVIWCAGVKHNFWTTLGKLVGKNELDTKQFKTPISSDSVITAFMVCRTIATKVGFDSKTFPIGWEDMDFATKIRQEGHDVLVLPWVKVWHDYPGAHFLRNKLRLYFEVRNRILFHKRWSTNPLQYLVSVVFSVTVGLSYIILSIRFTRDFIGNFRTVLKALRDGLFSKP